MAKDKKKKKKSEEEEEEIEDQEEIEEKKEKKKKKKKNKDKDKDRENDTEGKDDSDEEDGGRRSRKQKKKKKKKKKDKESEEEYEDSGHDKGKDDLSLDDATAEDTEKSEEDEKEKGKSAFEKSELFTLLTSEKEFSKETPKKVKELIANGANVNLRGEFNETYLHALMGPKPEGTESAVLAVLYQLVEAGLDVNSQDSEGFSPLHIAVLNDLSPRLVNALSKVGADPCALNNQEQDAMDLCELDTIRDVLEYFDMGLWKLVAAAEAGKVRALVNSWCKIELVNVDGKKLTELADEVGNEFIIEILKEFKNKNALVMAALSGNTEKLEKLTRKEDVDLNLKDWSYTRPSDGKRTHRPLLAECVSLGWFNCARLLVKKGADVNYEVEVIAGRKEPLYLYLFYLMAPQNNLDRDLFKQVLKKADFSLVVDHYTLAYQCWQLKVPCELFAQMVQSGLQIDTRDKDGYTVRDRILMENYEAGIQGERQKLREALYYVDQCVIELAVSGQVEQLEKLAQEGYDYINVANLKGKSIKKLAKKEDQKDVQKFLEKLPEFQKKNAAVQNGIMKGNLMEVRDNLNKKLSKTRDRNGRIPLIQAVLLERRFVIKHILKEFPKTVNATDFYGRTALHYACAIAQGGDIEDALVNAGADTELEDFDGKRPDEYQVRMGMSFIINERNKEMGANTFLLDRYIALLYAIEDGEDDRLSDILESLPVNFGLKDFDRLLPSRFPQLEYRPLLIIAVDSDREQMAIRLIELGASFHVAGRFKDMDANRTTMSLEEAAERQDMQELLEYIRKQRANEGEGRKAEVALKEMLRRDSVAFSQTEYQRGNTPDSLKSGSLPGIGEEEEEIQPQPKKRNHVRNAPPANQQPPSYQEPQQNSACTIL